MEYNLLLLLALVVLFLIVMGTKSLKMPKIVKNNKLIVGILIGLLVCYIFQNNLIEGFSGTDACRTIQQDSNHSRGFLACMGQSDNAQLCNQALINIEHNDGNCGFGDLGEVDYRACEIVKSHGTTTQDISQSFLACIGELGTSSENTQICQQASQNIELENCGFSEGRSDTEQATVQAEAAIDAMATTVLSGQGGDCSISAVMNCIDQEQSPALTGGDGIVIKYGCHSNGQWACSNYLQSLFNLKTPPQCEREDGSLFQCN